MFAPTKLAGKLADRLNVRLPMYSTSQYVKSLRHVSASDEIMFFFLLYTKADTSPGVGELSADQVQEPGFRIVSDWLSRQTDHGCEHETIRRKSQFLIMQ